MGAVGDTYAWPERDETIGAAAFTLQRGWREGEIYRHVGPMWTTYEIQRPPDQRWDILYVGQMECPEFVDVAAARADKHDWQVVADRWSAACFARVDESTSIEEDELGGEFAWRWTQHGQYEKKRFVGLCYAVLTTERIFFLRGYGPGRKIEDLDPAIELILHSFRVADVPNDLARETMERRGAITAAGRTLPEPQAELEALRPLLAAWRCSAERHEHIGPPANEAAIMATEASIGMTMPRTLRGIYEIADGLAMLEGNLMLWSLDEVERFATDFGSCDEAVDGASSLPPELLAFASNGSELIFALWLPSQAGRADAPVIAIDLGSRARSVAGTSLHAFLTGWTAYYLMVEEAPVEALDALGVPEELRAEEPDDDVFAGLRRWADPELPEAACTREEPVSDDELRLLFGG
jgi:hypothetical protein